MRKYGLKMWDRNDANGKQRLRIHIDQEGRPVMETLDGEGKVAR
ncbi:MAG TPA: hypothetical protein VL832_03525 [Puia sp.]|nr:hypothetical protein [Puia sp.]